MRQRNCDISIMLDDEQAVLRVAKKMLDNKVEVFHVSSALV